MITEDNISFDYIHHQYKQFNRSLLGLDGAALNAALAAEGMSAQDGAPARRGRPARGRAPARGHDRGGAEAAGPRLRGRPREPAARHSDEARR